ncbi:MAG: HlyD family secretion protein [Planctomycetaceae bacterium]
MRWLGILLISGSLAVGLVVARGGLARGPARAARSLFGGSADGQPARRVFAAGVVEGSQRDVALRFEVTGRIDAIHVAEGATVEKGDIIAELDARQWQQRVAEAEARLKLSRAERERLVNGERQETRAVLKAEVNAAAVGVREAEALYARGQQLEQRKVVSAQELDDYKFKREKALAVLQSARARLAEVEAPVRDDDLRIADARIGLAEATLRHERALFEKTRLRAPTDGVVLHILVEAGELVGPEDERALVTMANRDRTRVRAYIEELDTLTVSPGQKAVVTVDGRRGKEYAGTVLTCSPFVRGKSQRHLKPGELVDVKVREVVVELLDADELVIGLPVDVFIEPAGSQATAEEHRSEGEELRVSARGRPGTERP